MPEIPGLLPPNVQDEEGHKYSDFQASVGGMVDSYYEVCFQKPAIDEKVKKVGILYIPSQAPVLSLSVFVVSSQGMDLVGWKGNQVQGNV